LYKNDSIRIQYTGIAYFFLLSTLSSFRLNDQSCNLKQIAIFFSISLSLCVTIKDSLKVTFHTKQVATNILIGEHTEPIVLVYQGLLYTLYIGVYIYIVYVVIVLTLLYVMFILIFL